MKLQIMSDLHLEMHRDGGRQFLKDLKPLAGVLVLAGDIMQIRFLDQAEQIFKAFLDKFKTVIFVPGNHEYYQSKPSDVRGILTTLYNQFGGKLALLDPGCLLDYGIKIVGATMWFPFDPMNPVFAEQLNDFELIENFVPWVYEKNKEDVKFLEENVQKGDVVITHHLPTPLSISARYRTSDLNRFFLCNMGSLILDREPKLWVHGHSHDSCDYEVGNTRIISNPMGYPYEVTPFNEGFVIEV